jgi:hypothetical protein
MSTMTLQAAPSACPAPTGAGDDESYAAKLTAANINPRTYLATDYLNHFNEAIMLLEMIPDMPECYEDIVAWQPLSYAEHFTASNFKARDLAIEAYERADPRIRGDFDDLTKNMTMILVEVAKAMTEVQHDWTRAVLAENAVNWVKPMISHAGGIINGQGNAADIDYIMTH